MSEKTVYRAGFGPFAPEVYRAPAPYPCRGVSTDDAIADEELERGLAILEESLGVGA